MVFSFLTFHYSGLIVQSYKTLPSQKNSEAENANIHCILLMRKWRVRPGKMISSESCNYQVIGPCFKCGSPSLMARPLPLLCLSNTKPTSIYCAPTVCQILQWVLRIQIRKIRCPLTLRLQSSRGIQLVHRCRICHQWPKGQLYLKGSPALGSNDPDSSPEGA